MTKNSSGKHVWTKYISVLLTAFVFVAGIALCGTALAVDLQTAIDRTSKQTGKILENTTQSIIGGIASYTLFDILFFAVLAAQKKHKYTENYKGSKKCHNQFKNHRRFPVFPWLFSPPGSLCAG